jgi:hypothetical protein
MEGDRMAAGSNTKSNIGIRRVVATVTPPAERNFETNGSQLYKVVVGHAYTYANTTYAKGAILPYDGAGGTRYSLPAQLARDFALLWVDPAD